MIKCGDFTAKSLQEPAAIVTGDRGRKTGTGFHPPFAAIHGDNAEMDAPESWITTRSE
jgi:hypothetical protein